MPSKKYEHLVKPLHSAARDTGKESPFKNTGNADVNRWLNGRDHLEGMKVNFSWGFYTGLGDWHPGMDPHVHPYPEVLVFVGLDPDDIEYLGAEVQYCLGKELEVHKFDKPTVIIAPAGVPHCPSVTLDVTNPIGYGFFIISLGAEPKSTWMGDGISEERIKEMRGARKDGKNDMPMLSRFSQKKIHVSEENLTYGDKYDHLIKSLVPKPTPFDEIARSSGVKIGPGNSTNPIWMTGKDLEGMKLNFTWGFHKKPGIWHRGPRKSDGTHIHPNDELLVFVGTDPNDINTLGAEISVDMGEERERHIFDTPSVVLCPAGTPHGPVITRYVDNPFAFFLITLSDEYRTEYLQ